MRVTVMPVIGEVRRERLHSLTGCHAIYEKAVTKAFNGPSELVAAIEEALYELALVDRRELSRTSYILQFKD